MATEELIFVQFCDTGSSPGAPRCKSALGEKIVDYWGFVSSLHPMAGELSSLDAPLRTRSSDSGGRCYINWANFSASLTLNLFIAYKI